MQKRKLPAERANHTLENFEKIQQIVPTEARVLLKQALTDTPKAPNLALALFRGNSTASNPSHLNFNTWYHPDICHYLLHMMNNQAQCIRVIFPDAGYGNNTTTFKDQLQSLIVLSNQLNKPAFFISKEPGADNHFICGLVRNNNLFLMNPLGITTHKECYQTLAALQQETIIGNIWFSSSRLQQTQYEEGLVSCGAIALEWGLHLISKWNLEKLDAFWKHLKRDEPILHEDSQLRYYCLPLREALLPDNLAPLLNSQDETHYQEAVCKVRQSHGDLLEKLSTMHAEEARMTEDAYLTRCKNESPAQVVFMALLTGDKHFNNIQDLEEYKLLESALRYPEAKILSETKHQHFANIKHEHFTDTTCQSLAQFNGQPHDFYQETNLVPARTKGEGDCAFHAAFGEWDEKNKQFFCQNVQEKRRYLANKIRTCKPGDQLYPLVQAAIKALIMENRLVQSNLGRHYQAFKLKDDSTLKVAWQNFEEKLKEYPQVIKQINDFLKAYQLRQDLSIENRKRLNTSYLCAFQTWLNQDELATDIMSSHPTLYAEYKKYNNACSNQFDWDNFLSENSLIDEYAALIEQEGTWLIYTEIEILSHAFDMAIDYYTTDENNELLKVKTFNSSKPSHVLIRFNGVNHYERVINQSSLSNYLDFSALDENKEIKNKSYDVYPAPSFLPSLISKPTLNTTYEVEPQITAVNKENVVTAEELIDFPVLQRKMNELEIAHQQAIQAHAVIREEAKIGIAKLNLLSDEKFRLETVKETSNKIEKLSASLNAGEEKLIKAKEKTALLQEQFKQLEMQKSIFNLDSEVDEKVDWIIKRKALQKLHTENKAKAALRKIPLQQATLSGRTKVEQELQLRLTSVIAEMENEYKVLEGKQDERYNEKKYLNETLQKTQEELQVCIQDEKKKLGEYKDSEANLSHHKITTKNKTDEYKNTLDTLNKDLDKAQKELQTLTAAKDVLAADIRQTKLRIQYLNGKTTKTIQITTPVWRNDPTWHGHMPWGGWHDHWHWVDVPGTKVVEDTDVTAEIHQKQQHLASQKAQRNLKNTNINDKNKEIAQLQKKIEALSIAWKKTKSELNAENWKLEDASKKALGLLKDAEANKKQKNNDEAHLQESLRRKKNEIEHEQKIIDGRKNMLGIFHQDLKACLMRINNIQHEAKVTEGEHQALPVQRGVNLEMDTESNRKLAETSLNIKKSLDLAHQEEVQLEQTVIDLKEKMKLAKDELHVLTHLDDPEIVSDRQKTELVYKQQIEKTDRASAHLIERHGELLHAFLLGEGLVVTGYEPTADAMDNVIICLLQGIFAAYPSYQLNSRVNTPRPETWNNHLERIKHTLQENKIYLNQDGVMTPEVMTLIVDIVNEEYQQDGIALQVSLFGRQLEIHSTQAKNVVSLNLWQQGKQCLILASENKKNTQRAYGRAHKLLSALQSSSNFFRPLCENIILRDCGKSLTDCEPETLASYCREELQSKKNLIEDKKNGETHFSLWFKKYFTNDVFSPSSLPNHQHIYLKAAQYCLNTLNTIHQDLTSEQQEEVYQLCREKYFSELQSCIMGEIKRRTESESESKRLLEEGKSDLANKMGALEKEIKSQQVLIEKLAKEIKEKEIEFEKRKEQVIQLHQHHQNQSAEIENEIQHYLGLKAEVECQLQVLSQDTNDNEQCIKKLTDLKKGTASRLEKLAADKAEVLQKLNESRKAQLALQSEKIKLESDRKKFEEIRKKSETSKAIEDQKIKFLETWQKFLQGVHEGVLHDRKAFENRHLLLDDFKKIINTNDNETLLNAYQYLTTHIASLKKFDNQEIKCCIEQSKEENFSMLAANWPNNLKNVLDDVLGGPSISSEIISPITIQGNNISWTDVLDELEKRIAKRINHYGFGLNNHQLVVTDASLIGIINELPEALKKILTSHIELHCQHYTFVKENRVVQTPRWHELEEFLSSSDITNIINKAKINFTEILRAYVDSIEVIAGHHLYLDADIDLPGIHLTLFSKDTIHCNDHLLIKTTGRQLAEIQIEKAKSGHEYQAESGREGDDGLDGQAGQCGGHIVISAENTIENLAGLSCEASGSNGLNGQRAGNGSQGHKGIDMPDAKASSTDGFGKAQFIVSWGRIPGLDGEGNKLTNELSGPGGDAGLAGLGGGAGLAADIVIRDNKNELKLFTNGECAVNGKTALCIEQRMRQEEGLPGHHAKRDAKGGEPGIAGAVGADKMRNKNGFFSKTTRERGQYAERAYDHPEEFAKDDNAWGINVSIAGGFLGNSVKRKEYSHKRRKQVRVYGRSARVPMEKNESEYRQNPRRDKRSLGDHGKDNDKEGRQKSENNQRKTQHSKTMQQQLSQLTRINQIGTHIQNNHVWIQFDNDYKAEIAEYRGRSEQLAQEIEQCHSQEAASSKQAAEVSAQLQQVEGSIDQLDNQLAEINQLQNNLHQQLNANDLSQLSNIKKLAEQGIEKIQMQAELACANIDVNSEKSVQVQFDQLHKTVQSALQLCQNHLSQDIDGIKENSLLQSAHLALLQSEYARLSEAYNKKAATSTQENKLHSLMNELASLKLTEEITKESAQTALLEDALDAHAEINADHIDDLFFIQSKSENFFFQLPTPQVQYEQALIAFSNMFGKTDMYKVLETELQECKAEKIWIVVFKGLCQELKKQRDADWMNKHVNDWRMLLKYSEKIITSSSYSAKGLSELYYYIQALVKQLEAVDEKHQGKCLLALKNVSDVIEGCHIELLVEECVRKSSEGKEREEHRALLRKEFRVALHKCGHFNSMSSLTKGLRDKHSFIRSMYAFLAVKNEEKLSQPFAILMLSILKNLELLANYKNKKIKTTIDQNQLFQLFSKLNIILKLKENYKTIGQSRKYEKINKNSNRMYFECLQFEIEHLYLKNMAVVELRLNEGTTESKFSAYDVLKTNETTFLSLMETLIHADHPLAIKLFTQAAKKYQILLMMRSQLLFEDEELRQYILNDKNAALSQLTHSDILKNLYLRTKTCNKKRSNQYDLQKFAEETALHFVRTVSATPETWLAVLKENKNIEMLKMDQGFICLIIFQQIINSQQIDSIISAYEACKNLAKSDQIFQKNIRKSFKSLCLSALQKQIINVIEKLQSKQKSDPAAVQTIKEMLKTLSQLADLWFTPHCLLSLKTRFEFLPLLEKMEATSENLLVIRETLHQHLEKQKEKLLERAAILNNKENRVSSADQLQEKDKSFSSNLNFIIHKIELYFQKFNESSDINSTLLWDLDRYLLTLNLILKCAPDLITHEEMAGIEHSFYRLKKVLIHYLPTEQFQHKQSDTWLIINDKAQLLENIIDAHYFSIMTQQLDQIKSERHLQKRNIATLKKDISEHYDTVIKNEKVKRYPAAHQQFIHLLLEKIENFCLAGSDEENDSIKVLESELLRIKAEIKNLTSIEKIEKYLTKAVNEKGVALLNAKRLFAEMLYPNENIRKNIETLRKELTTRSGVERIFSAWDHACQAVLTEIQDTAEVEFLFKDESWFSQFVADSRLLFTSLITENKKQENSLLDKEIALQAWMQRLSSTLQGKSLLSLRQLIQDLHLSGPHSVHYLYSSRLLEQMKKNSITNKVNIKEKKWPQYILKIMQDIFPSISTDLGSNYTKECFVNELSVLIKPVYNFSEVKQQKNKIETLIEKVRDKMYAMDSLYTIPGVENQIVKLNNKAIKRLLMINFKQSLSVPHLIKIYLNIRQLSHEDLNELTIFSKKWIEYQAKKINCKDPEQIYYHHLISSQLAHLYRMQYLTVKTENEGEIALINYTDNLNHINKKPEISLGIYFNLCELSHMDGHRDGEKTKEKVSDDNVNKNISLLNTLLGTSFQTTLEVFTQFKDVLMQKKLAWQLPYLIGTLPYILFPHLPQKKCKQILEALTIVGQKTDMAERQYVEKSLQKRLFEETREKNFKSGSFCINYPSRIQLLQVMLGAYVHHHIYPKLAKDSPNREMVARIIYYIEKKITQGYKDSDNTALQKATLEKINHSIELIRKLSSHSLEEITSLSTPQSPSISSTIKYKVSIKKLLTPLERKLVKGISYASGKKINCKALIKQPPHEWEKTLRKSYFNSTCSAFFTTDKNSFSRDYFGELFTEAYIAAQENEGFIAKDSKKQTKNERAFDVASRRFANETLWLDCVNYLLKTIKEKKLQLEDVSLILKSVIATGTIDHISEILIAKEHPIVYLKECLFSECTYAIKCAIKEISQQDIILKQLAELKYEIFNQDEGHLFLQILSHALLNYRKNQKGYVYPAYFNELLALLIETKAYQYSLVPNSPNHIGLSENNLLQWVFLLKREKYVQLFGLAAHRSTKEFDNLVNYLNQLEKAKPQLMKKLTTLIQKTLPEFQRIDILNGFLINFVRQYWVLDEIVLNELECKPYYEWHAYLNSKTEERFAIQTQQIPDRDAKTIAKEMCKEIEGINKSVKKLIFSEGNSPSYIEKTINEIKSKFENEIKNWNETDIKNWVAKFNKNGAQLLNEHQIVVELAAILMRACSLKLDKIPRPTQLTALLLNIDAIQKGKGRLANISTGEGKSLITVMTAIVHGLRNEKVDIVTSNEVLAERDAKAYESIFELFSIKVSNNCDADCEKNENLRKERYTLCQVMYGVTSSFQRDILLTNFFGKNIRGQEGHAVPGNALIIDEVDNMFIDNAEKILYISHSIQDLRHLNDLFLAIWAAVNSPARASSGEENIDEVCDFIRKQITTGGVIVPNILSEFVERRLKIWVRNAYQANKMTEGREYIIPKTGAKHGEVLIMDLDTGVEQTTTQWSNGLHQFIQLKHSQKLSEESLKAVFMSNAVFFQSYNGHIVGLTGTVGSEIEMDLMSALYNIDYYRLPRNKPERYIQEEPRVLGSLFEWKEAILADVREKQFAKGSYNEKEIEKAKQDLEEAMKKSQQLIVQEEEIKKNILQATENENVLKNALEEVIKQLARDAVIDSPMSKRQDLLQQKAVKEKELAENKLYLGQLQKELESVLIGEKGIENNNNVIKNNEAVIKNSGARPILIMCANVNDVEYLTRSIESDESLTKCTITVLKSKDDPLPAEKLGPNDIIIATNIAGRGTDLETLPIVEQNKGLHVLQTSIPSNIRVEIQAFRRTARNGNKGSGKFIVCNEKINSPIYSNLTVEKLCEMRDIAEAKRIDRIRTQGIPKLHREQMLFLKFIELQRQIKAKLEAMFKDPKEFDVKHIEVQIKSLQNKWAFFLDQLDEKISDVEGIPTEQLVLEFEKFAMEINKLVDVAPFRLITEPAELMKMARYCMDHHIDKDFSNEAAYRLATEYLDVIIEKEEKFAGFAHYYKAHCNFGQKQNSLAHKASARTSLKKSIEILEDKIGRLSTAAQFIKVLRTRKQEMQGRGLEVDNFTRSLSNEISLLQVHINAAREVLGTALAPDHFKSATVTGNEHEVIFDNMRQHLKQILKNYRLSKKIVIKPSSEDSNVEAIYRHDKLIDLPPMSATSRDKVLFILKSAIGQTLEQREHISPAAFNELYITKQQFLDGLGATRYNHQLLFSLHMDVDTNAKGKWEAEVLNGYQSEVIQKIKQTILSLEQAMTEKQLLNLLQNIEVTEESGKAIIQWLRDKCILQANEVYLLNEEVRGIIKDYNEKITLRDDQPLDIAALNLSKFPEFNGLEEKFSLALHAGAELTRTQLNLPERSFQLLFRILKEKNYFKKSLIQRLNLASVFTNTAHHQDIEDELQRLYESNLTGNACELLLCTDPALRYNKLWSYLISMKVVKDPGVKFKLNDDPNKLLDIIKELIKEKISLIIANKNKDEQEKYINSIYAALKQSIGKIKQCKDLKIDPKTLQDFLQGGKVPPEIVDFTHQCHDIVLSLAEDRGWDWGAFAVAIIGIVQIAAGVLIGALTFGAAAFISAVLISEGIGDLVFAVQSGINGDFSWSAYGNHKWQSLLISVATAGIGVGIGAVATGASSSVSAFVQKFIVQLAEAGLTCAISLATDQLIKKVIALLLNQLDSQFEKWVRDSASYQLAEKRLTTLLGNMYDRFGASQAGRMAAELMNDNAQSRHANFINLFSAKLTETMRKLSSQLGIAATQLERSGNTTAALIGKIAKIAGHVATAADLTNKFRDIASLTPETLISLEKSLEHALQKMPTKQEDVLQENRAVAKDKFCKDILQQQTTVIISEIKSFLKSAVVQPEMQALLQMAVKPVNDMLNNELLEVLKGIQEQTPTSAHREDDISMLLTSPATEADAMQRGDEPSSAGSTFKGSRSPAGSPSINHHHKKSDSFAEKTHSRTNLNAENQESQAPIPIESMILNGINRGMSCINMIPDSVGVKLGLGFSATGIGALIGAPLTVLSLDRLVTDADGCFFGNFHDSAATATLKNYAPGLARELEIMGPALGAAQIFFPGQMSSSMLPSASLAASTLFSSARMAMRDVSLFTNLSNSSNFASSNHRYQPGLFGNHHARGAFNEPGHLIDLAPAKDIYNTQATVSSRLRDGTSISALTESMHKNGWDLSKPFPDMIRRPDGSLMTLDHRRIVAAQNANLPVIPTKIHGYNEPLSSSSMHADRYNSFQAPVDFTDLTSNRTIWRGKLPATWGEAASIRSIQQRTKHDVPNFPMHGRTEAPKITGKKN